MTAYVLKEIPKRCPRCGSTHVVEVTRHSADYSTWMCTKCYAGIEVPVESIKDIMTGSKGEEMMPLERTDMHLLERPLACWILLYVRAHPGCRASEVYESCGVYSAHDRTRVNQLAKTCLLRIHYDLETKGTTLHLTEGGQRVADALEAVREALLEHRERVCAEVGE